MSNLLGPFAIVSVVLAVGGVFKLRVPAPTHDLLRSLGLPPSDLLARLIGALEVGLGLAAVAIGGWALATLVAVAYAVFAVVSLRLVRGGSAASCGCFGAASAPPSRIHVAVDAIAALVATAAAAVAMPGVWTAREAIGADLWLLAPMVALGSWLLVVVLTVLPDTLDATRRRARPSVRTFELGSAR